MFLRAPVIQLLGSLEAEIVHTPDIVSVTPKTTINTGYVFGLLDEGQTECR